MSNYIKLFEEFKDINEKYIKYTIYQLSEESDNHHEEIYGIWETKEEAIEEAESYISEFENINSSVMLTESVLEIPIDTIIEYHEINKKEFISNKDYYIFDYIENGDNIFDYRTEVYTDIIRELPYKNNSTDELIDEVIDKLNDEFNRNYRNGFKKYTSLYKDEEGNLTFEYDNDLDYDDENYIEYEEVHIRIANHTHNPRNGRNDLNVLICNKDATVNRFFTARTDLRYDEDSDSDEIVNDIINYFK